MANGVALRGRNRIYIEMENAINYNLDEYNGRRIDAIHYISTYWKLII